MGVVFHNGFFRKCIYIKVNGMKKTNFSFCVVMFVDWIAMRFVANRV